MSFLLFLPLLQEAAPSPTRPWTDRERKILLSLSPLPPVPASPGNEVADDPVAAALGRALFFDPGLSGDDSMSCATCHDPDKGWGDGLARAKGRKELAFHTPSVVGAAFNRWQFWDGRKDSLWSQALEPIEHPDEMAGSRTGVLHHIRKTPSLLELWEAAFGPFPGLADPDRFPESACPAPVDPASPFEDLSGASPDSRHRAWAEMEASDQAVVDANYAKVGKAIGAFERLLVSGSAPFDRWVEGLEDDEEGPVEGFGATQWRGARLFIGKAGCLQCHFGPGFTDGQFHNVGMAVPAGADFDDGRPLGIQKVRVDRFNARGKHSARPGVRENPHLLYLAFDEHTYGAYKTPTLRNLGRTAPFGHDGRFATLMEVLDFYEDLPGLPPIGHREETLLPLKFSTSEKEDLVAFLLSLTSEPIAKEFGRPSRKP